MFPKLKRQRDEIYIDWIRTRPCCVSGKYGYDPDSGRRVNDPHHVNERGQGGTGTKCDDRRAVPLIHALHVELHQIGQETFKEKYNVDFEVFIAGYNHLYDNLKGKA